MKAIVIPRYGDASVLEVREFPEPRAQSGQVRIAVRAAGLNFAEVSARQGLYPDAPKPPVVVGYEVAGVVDALGPGVTGFAVGDSVWALTAFGGHAEKVCTPVGMVRRMAPGTTFEEAASVPVVGATAVMLVEDFGHLGEGERVLIHMAAGGVGLAALQLCRRVPGVTVFGTASSSKHAFLKGEGLHHAIDYRSQDYEPEVMRLTDGKGVHLILDPMGGRHWAKNYRLLAPLGRLMVFGMSAASGPGKRSWWRVLNEVARMPRFSPFSLMDKNRAVMGLNMGHLFSEGPLIRRGLDTLARLVQEKVLVPKVDSVFPFSKAADAHRRIEDRQNVGKVVLVPG